MDLATLSLASYVYREQRKKKMIKVLGSMGVAMALAVAFPAHADQTELFKAWKTHKGGFVTFAPCETDKTKTCGTISALAVDHSGPPPLDVNNPDPTLKSRELLGLQILRDFEYVGDGRWKNGTTYSTDTGKEYDSKIKIKDNGQLKVSGCVLFICETYEWDPAATQNAGALAE
ncbi:MAG: DUF2147 domain-containing protein [Proteobacteria bacterium]|nr:DUF2147 domain-containing protein [Pseudomonadota bacterium]